MNMRWMVRGALLLLAAAAVSQTPEHDRYGGWTKVKGSRTGLFHVELMDLPCVQRRYF